MKSNLKEIPGIGTSLEQDLMRLGYHTVDDLKKQDPEEMYERLCFLEDRHVDRCVLYTFRCAVYYAQHQNTDGIKNIKWWHFKDESKDF